MTEVVDSLESIEIEEDKLSAISNGPEIEEDKLSAISNENTNSD
jgi:hypothetical protein